MKKNKIILFLIFLLALSFRLYGLNWDQGQHLHPDERFLTMVTTDIKLPNSIVEYFNNKTSPLNPYNYQSYQFFVYGTLPIFLTKIIAVLFKLDNYENIVLVGRVLSAFFDSIVIFLLYFLSIKIINKKSKLIFLPSLLYAVLVLPIQLSHFFAVDTFLSTFILATFVCLIYNLFLPAAICFGLALACKISAVYFAPIIFIFLFPKFKKLFMFFIVTFVIFRIFQPYVFDGLFSINPQFIDNIKQLQIMSAPSIYFPPSIQWLSKTKIFFPLQNIIFWGLGIPLSFGFILVAITNFKKLFLNKYIIYVFTWIVFLFLYQGSTSTPTMRYFLPIYPFIVLLFVYLFSFTKKSIYLIIIITLHFIYGLAFLNIYSHNHTRVDASNWIYQNIPPQSYITNEYWDDPLPLNLINYPSGIYNQITLTPYDIDSPEKIDKLYSQIYQADNIIMSSNRLWGSIPLVPQLYPDTSQFYQNLFSTKLDFKKTLEVNSYPGFNLPLLKYCYYFGPSNFPGSNNNWFDIDKQCLYPGIYLRDDTAEEAFSVYDHPKVLIFTRTNQ